MFNAAGRRVFLDPCVVESLNLVQRVLLWLIPVVFAIVGHELAHGLAALSLGDRTAKQAGRLSLNPLKHLDPLGSLLVPAVFLFVGGFFFGWARPVPVNPQHFDRPKRDMVYVAAAGPLANLLMSLLWVFVMKLGYWLATSQPLVGVSLIYLGAAGVFINTAVMMLNLLPLPPLDGGRIVVGLLPGRAGRWLSQIEAFGMPILLLMIFVGMAGRVIWPMMVFGMAVSTHLVGIPVDLLVSALRVLLGVAP